jgi:hypothetical protein
LPKIVSIVDTRCYVYRQPGDPVLRPNRSRNSWAMPGWPRGELTSLDAFVELRRRIDLLEHSDVGTEPTAQVVYLTVLDFAKLPERHRQFLQRARSSHSIGRPLQIVRQDRHLSF